MGRPLRIDEPGDIHHLYGLGRARQLTFITRQDYEMFMALVRAIFADLDIELIAYCLMGNHYHLVVRSNSGHLSVAMQRLIGRYTKYFNRAHDLNGALFCGRFRSVTVKSRRQLLILIRYVHRNPQDISWVEDLSEYEWSSLAIYLNNVMQPKWLTPVVHPWVCKPTVSRPRRGSKKPTGLPRQGRSPMYPRNFEELFIRAMTGPEPRHERVLGPSRSLRSATPT